MNLRLIAIPSLITFAVTILRLTGELRHWSVRWFSPETGGITPSGVSWVVGITWLAAIFGAYFALKLLRSGQKPRSLARAGVLLFLSTSPLAGLLSALLKIKFPAALIFIWFLWNMAGALQYFGWPDLFRVLMLPGIGWRMHSG
jgi:hypothetical protein